MSGEMDTDISVATSNSDKLYLHIDGVGQERAWERLRKLSNVQIIEAFRWTASTLDQIAFEYWGAGDREWDPKTSEYYKGLVELKKIADERKLFITGNKPYEDMDDAHQEITLIFDPMQNPLIRELLIGKSPEEE